jgi:hypothetical protein
MGHKVSFVSDAWESLDNARRFRLTWAKVLSVVLLVLFLAGIIRFLVTGQLPWTFVWLTLSMCGRVAKLLPPWTTGLGRPGVEQEHETARHRKSE